MSGKKNDLTRIRVSNTSSAHLVFSVLDVVSHLIWSCSECKMHDSSTLSSIDRFTSTHLLDFTTDITSLSKILNREITGRRRGIEKKRKKKTKEKEKSTIGGAYKEMNDELVAELNVLSC